MMKEGWKIRSLKELCDNIRDGSHNPPKGVNSSNYLMLSSQNVQNGFLTLDRVRYLSKADYYIENGRTNVQKGDVLLTIVGTIGRTCVITGNEGNITFQRSVAILTPGEEVVSRYLMYSLLSLNTFLNREATGAAQKGIYLKQLSNITIPVPTPSEQQRIVDILDAEFAKIDALKANAEKNLQNVQDLFQAALKKELEPKEGWTISTIGDICDVQGGSTPRRTEPAYWKNGEYPWFTVDDIREQGRTITTTKQKITKLAWEKMRVFPANTVLLCCTASVGEYAITTIPLTSNQQFNGLTIKKNISLLPMYLYYYASTLKSRLMGLSGKATIDFVAASKVKSLSIAFPSSKEQQSMIVETLEALSKKCQILQDNYTQTLTLCDDLKQALLRKAFNGEL